MSAPAVTPDWAFEREHWRRGFFRVAGVDEAGRGAWAGPVTVAAVILPGLASEYPFRDSKQLTAAQRETLAAEVRRVAVAWAVEHAWPEEIGRLNILGATHAAAQRALARLDPAPQALVTDYLKLRTPLPLSAPPKADALSYSVAAASLLAKTERDRLMAELDTRHPGYGFAAHKGYGAPAHRAALERLGVSEVHRRSYAPIARLLEEQP
ncbi:ribonuclease HII [Deinococcus metallilatus]|uniref:Ribonuclease n=1 Tax=Deinococcus metallilatus TaxID=1211322 RepID=A0AAJ5JXZ6_9DEIO|nr:ribonuclease HII [Deinococcus metallilatus]MBB5296064.1 ribonuclease HII [Deinococcus metallilatus]QBY08127.1 ribonuclease HII [Deinococcus metallilatus]RXJ11860.1 ribonuclease HII [Deinococcus metallilatus]TLK25909.1 ribonuclease HII [Deinococcus metallilatus]GMA14399.1 ribonuclease [Deinococcus metallilatus]